MRKNLCRTSIAGCQTRRVSQARFTRTYRLPSCRLRRLALSWRVIETGFSRAGSEYSDVIAAPFMTGATVTGHCRASLNTVCLNRREPMTASTSDSFCSSAIETRIERRDAATPIQVRIMAGDALPGISQLLEQSLCCHIEFGVLPGEFLYLKDPTVPRRRLTGIAQILIYQASGSTMEASSR